MSVVAVKKSENKLVFASDSIKVSGWTKQSDKVLPKDMAKLFELNDMVIGSVGYSKELSFMRIFAATHKPKSPSVEGLLDFIIEFYSWAMRIDPEFERSNEYLIGFENKVFRITEGYLVDKVNEISAIGAGEDFALAAMHLGHSAIEAVEVANELCLYCAPPICVIEKTLSQE